MTHYIIVTVICILSLAGCITMLCLNMESPLTSCQAGIQLDILEQRQMRSSEPRTYSKLERMAARDEDEFEKTRDPALNRIPRERLRTARSFAQMKRARRDAVLLNWEERGPTNVGGRTRAILIDAGDPTAETVFAAGVAGGLWKTTQISSSDPQWTAVDDFFANLAICAIAQDKNRPDTMYFGTGEGWSNFDAVVGDGIWRSTDGGSNWTQLSSTNDNTNFSNVNKLLVDDNGHVYAACRGYYVTHGGLFKSTDAGNSWTLISSGGASPFKSCADIEIAANGDLFASFGIFNQDGIYKSDDDGMNWTALDLDTTGYYRIELATAPSDSNYVYALLQASGTNDCLGVFRSTDGGSTWQWRSNPTVVDPYVGTRNFTRGQAWYNLIAAVDPTDEDRIFIGGIDILLSTNGGASFSQLTSWYGGGGNQYVHADNHMIYIQEDDPDHILIGNDGGLYRSSNGTASTPSFSHRNQGYRVTQFYSCAMHPDSAQNYYLAGTQDNGTRKFTSAGENPTTTAMGGDGGFCFIDQDQSNIQIASTTSSNYYVSTNGGSSFGFLNLGVSLGRFINPTDYDSESNVLYFASNTNRYGIIDNVGSSWTFRQDSIPEFGGGLVSAVKVSPNVDNRVYFGVNGRLVRVDNAHDTATATGTLLGSQIGYLISIDVEKGNEDHLLVTYSNFGIQSLYEISNATDPNPSWVGTEGNLPDMPVRWGIFQPDSSDQAIIATDVGVWSTKNLDGGSTDWDPSNGGLANVRTDMLCYRDSDLQLMAATHGRGVFTSDDLEPAPPIECPDMKTVSGAIDPGTYRAAITLSSDGTISAPDNVTFYAGNAVLLEKKFTAQLGSGLEAGIAPCPPTSPPPVMPIQADIGTIFDGNLYLSTRDGNGGAKLPSEYILYITHSKSRINLTNPNSKSESQ